MNQKNNEEKTIFENPIEENVCVDQEHKYNSIKKAWVGILESLYGPTWAKDPNLTETPHRIAKSMVYERCENINCNEDARKLLKVRFPSKYKGFIVTNPISVDSLCPHHFENVNYKVVAGYIPMNGVVGLSKIGRVIKAIGRQPILQEDYIMTLADIFMEELQAEGVGVIVSGVHNCMVARGLQATNSDVTMAEMRGTFRDNPSVKQEFYELVKLKLRG